MPNTPALVRSLVRASPRISIPGSVRATRIEYVWARKRQIDFHWAVERKTSDENNKWHRRSPGEPKCFRSKLLRPRRLVTGLGTEQLNRKRKQKQRRNALADERPTGERWIQMSRMASAPHLGISQVFEKRHCESSGTN